MFTELSLTNFRQHKNRSVSFGPGLVALRGANEVGKSGIFESMAYAMFGVDALREPLADVVTWGEKESSLKVVLKLNVNTNQVEISRGKSGAEIKVDGKLVATGQKEVTRFVEGLLGTAPKVAAKLMLANQASLRGALSEGPTATAQLIEQLSNFALIDEVIQLVQERLPSGSAVAAEERVKSLAARLDTEKPGELDLRAHEAELRDVQEALVKEETELQAAQTELPAAKAAADAARALAKQLEGAQARATGAREGITRTEAALARLNLACSVTAEDVERLRQDVKTANSYDDAMVAYRAMVGVPVLSEEWDDSRDTFDAAVAAADAGAEKAGKAISALQLRHAEVAGRLIKEQACAFCGKDLKDVPEVVLLNSTLGAELAKIKDELATWKGQESSFRAEQQAYALVARADRAVRDVFARHHAFMRMEEGTVPPKLVWTGPDLGVAAPTGALQALRAAEAEVQRAAQEQGKQVSLSNELARLQGELLQAEQVVKDLAPKVKADRSGGLETDLLTKIQYHKTRALELNAQVSQLNQIMASARQMHQFKVDGYARIVSDHTEALRTLEELQLNNVLLKKLRAARPKVADKLWGTVLSTVSYYFSAIRGVQSVVTRDDSGFRVDGKPVPGLSGSTLDALGLAIRIALTKTFLPNNDFLILDEPAAACDDERESNMLGVITTAGFDQVLLVTHSALADAFAEQVVTL